MSMVAADWRDFAVLDTGNGQRLEQWGDIVCVRPDPQVLWGRLTDSPLWDQPHLRYHRSNRGGGRWERLRPVPARWSIRYDTFRFYIKPTDFKHMGLFPEQAANWRWMQQMIRTAGRTVRVLNLFAYTGAATVACAAAGAEICHVDAARGMVAWARENLELSGLTKSPVRFIVDDVISFVRREQRRGKQYDAIVMDPPSYGRGSSGQTWKIETHLPELLAACHDVLSERPLFFVINSYTAGYSPIVFDNILKQLLVPRYGGTVQSGELALPIRNSSLVVPCGMVSRWVG